MILKGISLSFLKDTQFCILMGGPGVQDWNIKNITGWNYNGFVEETVVAEWNSESFLYCIYLLCITTKGSGRKYLF